MNSSGQDLARQIHTDLQSANCLKSKFVHHFVFSVEVLKFGSTADFAHSGTCYI